METWDHAHCLPYFKRMENCLAAAADDPFRGHDGPLVLERGPAKGPLFDAFFEAVQQAGYPLTERRQRLPPGGLRGVRPQRARRPPAVGRARLPAPGDATGRTSTVTTRASCTRILFEGKRAVGVEYRDAAAAARRVDAGRGHPLRRRDQLAAAAAALRGRRRRRPARRSGRRRARPAGRRREPPGPPRGVRAAPRTQPVSMAPYFAMKRRARSSAPSGCCARPARARRTTSRPAASCAGTTRWPTRT